MSYKAKVYLSGGLRSNWQEEVIKEAGNDFIFFNPKTHGIDKPELYSVWSLYHIKQCDIFFAYMEESNPAGYALSLELGIASTLGKTIILIDEKSIKDDHFDRYFRMIQCHASVVFPKLEVGIEFLNKIK